MAERYSRIYTLPGNLYSDNAPVIIAAGALLKDNQTGKLLAQLKIQNLDEVNVTEYHVTLTLLDIDGSQIGAPICHCFSQISVEENGYFGQKEPIVLPSGDVHSFRVAIRNITLYDGTEWDSEKDWFPLPVDTNITDIKEHLRVLRQRKAEEEQKEFEKKQNELRELEQIKEKEREVREVENRKRRKRVIAIAACVVSVLIAVWCFVDRIIDNQTRKALLPELLNSSWEHHSYFPASDSDDWSWDFRFTLIFSDEEKMTYISKMKKTPPNKSPIIDETKSERTWKITSISSNKARISSVIEGKKCSYTIYFENKNGNLEISKIVDNKYNNVYYPQK